MVTAASKSHGACHTCKRRRVKCDRSRPVCDRCVKGNFECLGYRFLIKWKHTSQSSMAISRSQVETSEQSTSQALSILQQVSRPLSPPPQLNLSAFKSEVCFARFLDNPVWFSFGIGWFEEAITGKLGSLPYLAIKALSTMNFGRMENIAQLKLEGSQHYGQALQAMVVSLESRKAEDLLLPSVLMMMYAVYYPYRQYEALVESVGSSSSGDGIWGEDLDFDRKAALSHSEGIAKILDACGPTAFKSPLMRNVLDCARISLGSMGIYTRTRLSLEDYSWRIIPWSPDPFSKSEQSKLIDIWVVIPGLLQDYLSTAASVDGEHQRSILASRAATQLELLFLWRWQWQRRYGSGIKLARPTDPHIKLPQPLSLPLIQFDYTKDAAVRAAEISLYNALLLWILAILWNTKRSKLEVQSIVSQCATRANPAPSKSTDKRKFEREASLFDPLSYPARSIGLRTPATEIFLVFEWQSQNHHTVLTATNPIPMYLHPLSMAMSLLDEEKDVRLWVEKMINRSPHTFSFQPGLFKRNGFRELVTDFMIDPELSSTS